MLSKFLPFACDDASSASRTGTFEVLPGKRVEDSRCKFQLSFRKKFVSKLVIILSWLSFEILLDFFDTFLVFIQIRNKANFKSVITVQFINQIGKKIHKRHPYAPTDKSLAPKISS